MMTRFRAWLLPAALLVIFLCAAAAIAPGSLWVSLYHSYRTGRSSDGAFLFSIFEAVGAHAASSHPDEKKPPVPAEPVCPTRHELPAHTS